MDKPAVSHISLDGAVALAVLDGPAPLLYRGLCVQWDVYSKEHSVNSQLLRYSPQRRQVFRLVWTLSHLIVLELTSPIRSFSFNPDRYLGDTLTCAESSKLPNAMDRDHWAFGAGWVFYS